MQQFLIVIILSLPIRTNLETSVLDRFNSEFIVWNVGQGLFTTLSSENQCVHFDSGGEFFPLQRFLETCKRKSNQIHLSHLDWDHINFARIIGNKTKACLTSDLSSLLALAKGLSKNKSNLLASLDLCDQTNLTYVEFPPKINKKLNSNELSRVVIAANQFLVSGDSPSSQEKYWSPLIPKVRVFVLGHHGSRTSNSANVFARLQKISMAVASARKKKYGHPHLQTLKTARKNKTPVLLTEDWGSLHFQI